MRRPTPGEVRRALRDLGRAPSRRFGQHFLFDRRLLAAAADAAGVRPGAVVLEVGPGAGTLTAELLSRGAVVLAVEVDPVMAEVLLRFVTPDDALDLLVRDALDRGRLAEDVAAALRRAVEERRAEGYTLCANLPYQIASPLLVALWSSLPPRRGAVTVQWEVARRLVSAPGERGYGPLTALLAPFARFRIVRKVGRGAFHPPPRVDSAIVAMEPARPPEGFREAGWPAYRDLVHRLFQARRKSLRAALRLLGGRGGGGGRGVEEVLERASLAGDTRVESLSARDFVRLALALRSGGTG